MGPWLHVNWMGRELWLWGMPAPGKAAEAADLRAAAGASCRPDALHMATVKRGRRKLSLALPGWSGGVCGSWAFTATQRVDLLLSLGRPLPGGLWGFAALLGRAVAISGRLAGPAGSSFRISMRLATAISGRPWRLLLVQDRADLDFLQRMADAMPLQVCRAHHASARAPHLLMRQSL